MPAGGWPLMLYLHGSGGEYREGMDRGPLAPTTTRDKQGDPPPNTGPADWLAAKGIAVMGFDFPLHGDRESPPDTTGRMLYDVFGDIDSSVDNMQVSAMEVQRLTRLVAEGLTVDTPQGTMRFDPTQLTAMGHSMGSTIGIPVATVDPRVRAWVFSGAGGLITEIATSTTYPVRLQDLVSQLLGFEGSALIDRAHPLLHGFQSLWDFTDPSAKARHVALEPLPGKSPHPAMLPQGLVDGYFHPWAQTSVAVALGVTHAGALVNQTTVDSLQLAGRPTQTDFPVMKNVNGVTVASSQVDTPFELGHFVVFDRPDVQRQVECFVLGLGRPSGPTLVAPDAACP
jgi:pimeloyl-ACP methyl ester carboxylesterase